MIRATLLVATLAAQPTHAADFGFCWRGAGGYSMAGEMTIPDAALDAARASGTLLTEADVTHFAIAGRHDGIQVGGWRAFEDPSDTFHLRFDAVSLRFPTGGSSQSDYQAWNADGTASNCGTPGFGFNAGNNAQDLCIDGNWITASMVDRFTAFPVREDARLEDCWQPPLLSHNSPARRAAGDSFSV